MATSEGSSPSLFHSNHRLLVSQFQTFSGASSEWLECQKLYIRPNTIRSYRDALKALVPFLGELHTDQMQLRRIREYQRARTAAGITPRIINRELGVFRQVMKEHDSVV